MSLFGRSAGMECPILAWNVLLRGLCFWLFRVFRYYGKARNVLYESYLHAECEPDSRLEIS